MKNLLLSFLVSVALFSFPEVIFGQAPNLGTSANFVLFSTNGAVSNTGISQLTGNVGTNSGSSTAFGNVNGVMHDNDAASAKCAADLLVAYNQLNSAIPTFFPAPLLGNGVTLVAGIYSIASTASLNLDLTLDAKGNSNAVFIFQIKGAFSTSASSSIKLVNGAMACNVFWKVEGLVDMASGTSMKGTIIANNAAIVMNTGCTLEGRALSTAGAITVDGVLAYTPIGCGSPTLTGPVAPDLASTACYILFSGNGSVTNTGITTVKGDVGTNVGLTTGFDALKVSGTIHPIPDASTAKCAVDLVKVYTYLNTLTYDIELLYPVQFGNDLVLTPHTYLLNAATVFTGKLYLNAQGNSNAVFVIKIKGALSTSTYSEVILTNGAQSKNVYWMIEGAVSINNYSVFRGTIICHDGALGAINTGVTLDGRALTTSGSLTTNSVTSTLLSNCAPTAIATLGMGNANKAVDIYPNPFTTSINFMINDASQMNNCELKIYNILGVVVIDKILTTRLTSLETSKLPSGIYLYKLVLSGVEGVNSNNKTIQSGKLISRQ
ncbi:MAG: ice-binding family protein [Bacteroidota bacterium]|nr:ice-binding family protein [Bacteroidota bacterium]